MTKSADPPEPAGNPGSKATTTERIDLDDLKAAAKSGPETAYQAAGYVGNLKREGGTFVGPCPFHEERTPSFKVFADGGFKCFGCDAAGSIIDFHLRLNCGIENPGPKDITPERMADLGQRLGVAPRARAAGDEEGEPPWSVTEYAAHVLLPRDQLFEWGIIDRSRSGGIHIPYRNEEGDLLRNRVRLNRGKRWWEKGADHGGDGSYLYGLDQLDGGKGDEPLLIVEGESDCQVAWWCDLRALGAPGQNTFKAAWLDHLPIGTETLYVLREPDGKLPETVAKAAREAETERGLPNPPEVLAFELADGDLLDLWRATGCNAAALHAAVMEAVQAAQPLWPPEDLADLTQAQALLMLAETNTVELFHEAIDERRYAQVTDGDHRAVFEIHSGQGRFSPYRAWLLRLYRDAFGSVPSANAVAQALAQIEADAWAGERRALHLRVAWHDDALLIDRGDDAWSAFRVTANGWEIVEQPPPVFRRYSHMQPYPDPQPDGELAEIFNFISIRDERDQLLMLTWIIAGLVPDIPRPPLSVTGEAGSGKTSVGWFLRRLMDPSALEVLRRQRDEAELLQTLAHHFFVPLDNLSSLPEWVSDILCMAVTGGGTSKRTLYSDDEDTIFKFKRLILLTGVSNVIQRPDLFDRSLHIGLTRIDPFIDELELRAEFERRRPALLGALLAGLSNAMRIRRTLKSQGQFRMADFALWGRAAAEALGFGEAAFAEAYIDSVHARHEEAVEASPFATAVVGLMDERDGVEWVGTAAALLSACEALAQELRLDTSAKTWPRSAAWAGRRLEEAASNLHETGIEITFQRDQKVRTIRLSRGGPQNLFAEDDEDPFTGPPEQ